MNYKEKVEWFFEQVLDSLFPIRAGEKESNNEDYSTIANFLNQILKASIQPINSNLTQLIEDFVEELPSVKIALYNDVEAIYEGDPAAESYTEIILAYPGFYAIAAYRLAHILWSLNVPLIPRIITEHAHNKTGIDIHPAAQIGSHLCIDHGTGVVIGQTCEIGNNVKIYQGVTLGALSIPKTKSKEKRHPTIEDNVVIYAQATILGGDTVIGHCSIVGGNVWLTHSIEPYTKITFKASDLNIEKIEQKELIIS